MKWREFFTGGETVREARKIAEELGKNQTLSKREEKKLRAANKTLESRRAFVRKMLLAAVGMTGLTGSAGIFWMTRDEEEQSKNEAPDLPQEGVSVQEREALTDDLIRRAQEAIKALEQKVADNLEAMPESQFKRELVSPFEVARINENNPEFNGPRFHRLASESGQNRTILEDPYFFYYEAVQRKSDDRMAATWSPVYRIMSLATDFDPQNLMDALVLYHELRHVAQTTNTHLRIKSQDEYEEWLAFHSYDPSNKESPRMILNEEATAYAFEIEILNLILEGKLERKLTAGEELDMGEVAAALDASPQSTELIPLLSLAKAYYFEKFDPSAGLNTHFMNAVYDDYAQAGYEIYAEKSTGELGLYER